MFGGYEKNFGWEERIRSKARYDDIRRREKRGLRAKVYLNEKNDIADLICPIIPYGEECTQIQGQVSE